MSKDTRNNVIKFTLPKKQQPEYSEDCYTINNITFSMDELGISFTQEALDKIIEDMVLQDMQQDQVANACFDLQLLVEEHPEIAQYVLQYIKTLTENMKKRLS